jgi:predicted metalloprotease with PDZ domain
VGGDNLSMISYRIDCSATRTHLFQIELSIPEPASEQRLSLPAWIPGSYLLREFARHLSSMRADQGGRPVPLRQLDKATWLARCQGASPLVVRYQVYAFDTSVRAAYLAAARGFFNGTGVCLRIEGREREPHAIGIVGLPAGWEVATALEPRAGAGGYEFVAPDYDALADTPVELGPFWRGRFEAAGTPHEFVVAGALPDFDGEQLLADTRRICEAQVAFWHGAGKRPPFGRYVFMLNALDDGHGGLEHGASTALVAPRRDLPRRVGPGPGSTSAPAASERSDGYVGVLGLVSHEYFHAWNVKRLRPRELATIDYTRENYTELLWFFEGFTSYYDDLFLVRTGIVDAPRYLKLVAKTMSTVLAAPGRRLQSLAEASFDAWVKYYRADENTPNATISYYAKGALAALAFDLTLRSEGRGSLDDVMRRLWQQSSGGPIDEADIGAALEAVGGRSFSAELAAWVHGTDELPLDALLARVGVAIEPQPATLAQRLGVRVSESALTGVKVSHVLRGGAGEHAGIEAGDELIAVAGWRLRRLDDALRCLVGDEPAPLLVSRDQRVLSLQIDPATLLGEGAVQLRTSEAAGAAERALCEAWLAG